MADEGNNQNIGTLTTAFAADFTKLRQGIEKEYPDILKKAQAATKKIRFATAPMSAAVVGSIIPDAMAVMAGKQFASVFAAAMATALRQQFLSAGIRPLLLNAAESGFMRDKWSAGKRPEQTMGQMWGADYFRQANRARRQLLLEAAEDQRRIESSFRNPFLLNAAYSEPRGIPGFGTFEKIREEKARVEELVNDFGRNIGRGLAFKFPGLHVGEINKFTRSLDDASGSLMKVGAGISVVSGGLAWFSKSAVMASADFTEWQNVFNQVFKTILPQATSQMQRFASDFNLSIRTAQKGVGDIGELLVGIQFSEKQALDISMRVNRIAMDVVSFRNTPGGANKAIHEFFMGMMGNSQALKTYGIALRQNSPEFKAMEKSIMASTGATLQQARALAVLSEIEKQSSYAVGDYSRTWYTFANATRYVEEQLNSLKVAFGDLLIKGLRLNWVLLAIGGSFSFLAANINSLPWVMQTAIGLFTVAAIATGPLIVGIGMLGFAITNVIRGWRSLIAIFPGIKTMFSTLRGAGFSEWGIDAIRVLGVFAAKLTIIVGIFAIMEKLARSFWAEVSSWHWGIAFRTAPMFNSRVADLASRPSRNMGDSELGNTYSGMSQRLRKTNNFADTGFFGLGSGLNAFIPAVTETMRDIAEGFNPRKSTSDRMKEYIQQQMKSGGKIDLSYLDALQRGNISSRVARRMYKNAGGDYDELGKPIAGYKLPLANAATNSQARYAEAAIYGTVEGVKAMNRPPSQHETKTEGLLGKIEKNTRKVNLGNAKPSDIGGIKLSMANF